MGVARAQTVEDGPARDAPFTTLHFEGGPQEFIRVEMVIRRPWALTDFDRRLIIRASDVTGIVTAALERIRVE